MRPSQPAVLAGALALVVAAPLAAQPTPATEVAQVRAAASAVTTPAAARIAGFEPAFGWFSTMGQHWVSAPRMAAGRDVRAAEPSQLMFSPIAGHDSLVGAAYAYFAPVADTTRPALFASRPAWHEHPNLAPPGQTLVMLHVWFVPSPDGPFAGHNPNLPFWALRLTPPPASRFTDPTTGPTARRAALALGEIADTAGVFPVLAARQPLHGQLAALRDSVRPLVAEIDAAQKAGDWARWDRAAARAAGDWQRMRDAYLAAVVVPERRPRMARFLDEMATGAQGHDKHTMHDGPSGRPTR
jgi:hypothetical protein